MIPSQVWMPKPMKPAIQAPNIPISAAENEREPVAIPAITYSSWADEVEAAELAREDEPANDKPAISESSMREPVTEEPGMREPVAEELPISESAISESAISESAMDELSGDSSSNEDLLDYEETPAQTGMDINMVYYLPAEFRAIDEDG